MRLRVSAVLVLLTLFVLAARAQQPATQPTIDTPIFRSTVDAIELDAFVVDANGNPVTDLDADDFEIFADGKPQELTAFAVVNIPFERVERRVVPTAVPDVRTNNHPEGRIYLFAIDEIPAQLVPRLRLRLRQFIEEHFEENDRAALVYVGRGKSTDGQDFTSDRAMLLKSIERLSGGFGGGDLEVASRPEVRPTPTAPTGEATDTATTTAAAPPPPPGTTAANLLENEAEFLLRSRMLSLRTLTEFMANMRGRRKSIVYVTTGLGASVYEALDYDGGIRSIAIEDLHGAITAATRGNVSIYPMDPGGIVPGRDITEQAVPDPDNTVPEASLTSIGRMQDLRALAETTGGFAIISTNNYTDAYTRVVRENSSYYILGFSTTPQADGRFHAVEIRVKRPGLQVRSRGGYLAPLRRRTPIITRASTLAPAVVEALQSPIGVAGVPIRMFAAPYKGIDQLAKVAVAAEFGVEALNLVERSGRFTGNLAVALRPTSAEGKLLEGQRHEMVLALKPETYEIARKRGVRVVTEISLPPGRYQLRVAGGPTVGAAGSVTYDLEIPSFTKEPLLMSGVALTSSTADETVTVWPGAARPLDTRLPSPISVAREFWPEEIVTLYTEVYENGRRPAHTIDFKVDLRSASGRVMSTFTARQPSSSGSEGRYSFTAPIRLEDVEPGSYVLHVAATSTAGAKETVTREIPIRVR
ncbi:MAG: VWA domain-containing protein [Vicinamibacterales bacterium]